MRRSVASDVLLGALAGAAGTLVMDQVTTRMYERESHEAREREDDARGDLPAYEIAAERAATMAGRALTSDQRTQIGNAIHWSLGIAPGALYGLLRHRFPELGVGSGLLLGLTMFVILDEGLLPVTGITPGPLEFPWQTHARGLVGHLVLGAVIELPFNLLDTSARSEL